MRGFQTIACVPHEKIFNHLQVIDIAQKMDGYNYVDTNIDKEWTVKYNDEELRGFGRISYLNNSVAYLGPTYVSPKYRGQGLQESLIQTREHLAQARNIKKLIAITDTVNIYSSNNLIRQGFELKKFNFCCGDDQYNMYITLDGINLIKINPKESLFWEKQI